MPVPYPELTLQPTKRGMRYKPVQEDWRLPYDEWVPLISAIHESDTIGRQREALTYGIFMSSLVTLHQLGPTPEKIHTWLGNSLRARFSFDPALGTTPILKSVRAGYWNNSCAAGYLSDQQQTIIDSDIAGHEVYRDVAEPLRGAGLHLSRVAVAAVANALDNQYPGFRLPTKLMDAGVPIS
jgi:hypothetical protein